MCIPGMNVVCVFSGMNHNWRGYAKSKLVKQGSFVLIPISLIQARIDNDIAQ